MSVRDITWMTTYWAPTCDISIVHQIFAINVRPDSGQRCVPRPVRHFLLELSAGARIHIGRHWARVDRIYSASLTQLACPSPCHRLKGSLRAT